jgi:divalent metal cation (Fe/Co/Zn/Cd) transporter
MMGLTEGREPMEELSDNEIAKYSRYALLLGMFTVVYNLAEAGVSIAFGVHDQALTLFGFGVDSLIEVISGLGIVAMILRIQRYPDTPRSAFEKTALQVTGSSLFLLALGLLATAVYNIATGRKPENTVSGVIISVVAIAIMWVLVYLKTRVGRRLNSAPILADASCSKVCIYMSAVVLAASLLYAATGIGYVDSLGALGLIYFAVHEGREAFEKARDLETCAGED